MFLIDLNLEFELNTIVNMWDVTCRELGGNDGGQYVLWFYTTEALRNTWRPKMHSYSVGSNHKTIEGSNWAPYPATKRTEPGRSRTNRIHGDMDEADATYGLRKCKICK